METLIYSLLFITGCIVGSFLNVVVDRLPEGKTIIWGHSRCDFCHKHLRPSDLIPVISFAILGGKCRYCRRKLSYYYPIGELTTGILFSLAAYALFGQISLLLLADYRYLFALIYYLITTASQIIIFFTDLKYGIIPFKVVFFSLVTTSIWFAFNLFLYATQNQIILFPVQNALFPLSYIFSGLGVFLFFLLLFMGTKGRGIGFGDVVFVGLMGVLLGFPKIILGIYIAFLTGAAVSLILVLLGRKRLSGGTIPFGPFLVLGTIVSLFLGNWIIGLIITYLLHI